MNRKIHNPDKPALPKPWAGQGRNQKSKGARKDAETQSYRKVFSFVFLCATLAASRLCVNAFK
jgi:hypothetical protein